MENPIKIIASAVIVAIAAFAYVFGRGRNNKKIADFAKKDVLSYEDIIVDLKSHIARNKEKYSNLNLKMQILSSETVLKMSDFLRQEGAERDFITEKCIGFILLANNNPTYIKLYSFKELAQDLLDILPKNGIYEQEIVN